MHHFQVSDMTCGHCAATIEKAAKSVDGDAVIRVDLASRTVEIESAEPAGRFAEAIGEAGYSPELK